MKDFYGYQIINPLVIFYSTFQCKNGQYLFIKKFFNLLLNKLCQQIGGIIRCQPLQCCQQGFALHVPSPISLVKHWKPQLLIYAKNVYELKLNAFRVTEAVIVPLEYLLLKFIICVNCVIFFTLRLFLDQQTIPEDRICHKNECDSSVGCHSVPDNQLWPRRPL